MREGLRSIHLAHVDVTVAPITSRIRGVAVEVPAGAENGLDHASVVNLDDVQTIPRSAVGRHVGSPLPRQEPALGAALRAAHDLD